MEYSPHFAAGALAVTIGKVAFNCGRYWWSKTTLRELYITRAADAQISNELVTDDEAAELQELLEVSLTSEFPEAVKKRIRKHRGSYRNYLVQVGQAKFGCPSRNEANRLCVRKHLFDTCVADGLLARHINDHIDIATELVFIPSRSHLTAAAIRHTELSRLRLGVMQDLAGPRPSVA